LKLLTSNLFGNRPEQKSEDGSKKKKQDQKSSEDRKLEVKLKPCHRLKRWQGFFNNIKVTAVF